jgi:hypothetical protein
MCLFISNKIKWLKNWWKLPSVMLLAVRRRTRSWVMLIISNVCMNTISRWNKYSTLVVCTGGFSCSTNRRPPPLPDIFFLFFLSRNKKRELLLSQIGFGNCFLTMTAAPFEKPPSPHWFSGSAAGCLLLKKLIHHYFSDCVSALFYLNTIKK